MKTFDMLGVASDYEELSSITDAIGFTSSKIAPTTGDLAGKRVKAALLSAEIADIRFTLDGTTPTVTAGTAVGHLLYYGNALEIRGYANIANFKCINAVNGSGSKVKCTFFF